MIILGIDPGGTTGIACIQTDDWTTLYAEQLPAREAYARLKWFLTILRPDVVQVEKFVINMRTIKNTPQYDALYLIGWVKGLCYQERINLLEATANNAKTMWPNERLREVGMWVPGLEHARDAMRHALHGAVRSGLFPPNENET